MPRKRRFERLAVPAGMIAAAAGYFALVDGPKRAATAALREQTLERQNYILAADGLSLPIKQAEARLNEAEDCFAAWREQTPRAEEAAAIYARLHGAILRAGASVVRFEPHPPTELSRLNQVPVSLTFAGTHDALVRALVEIERLPESIWIKDVRLSGLGQTAEKIQFEARLVLFADRGEKSD